MATGWFGIPGGPSHKSTKVHYVWDWGSKPEPVCKARIDPRMIFQYCAAGFEARYVECAHCRRIGAKSPWVRPK